MVSSRKESTSPRRKRPPATSPEAREQQLISLAVDLAERQLSDGTASSAVISHYLKLTTTREQLEQEKLRREIALSAAREDSIASAKRIEELYTNALDAMRVYQGRVDDED